MIEYIDKGYIHVNAIPEKLAGVGAAERWDGHLGMGNLNAASAMKELWSWPESLELALWQCVIRITG